MISARQQPRGAAYHDVGNTLHSMPLINKQKRGRYAASYMAETANYSKTHNKFDVEANKSIVQ